jgi:signal transduction histidine kinase
VERSSEAGQRDRDALIVEVSHELRTTLTPLVGFLHALERRGEELPTEERQRLYELAVHQAQRMQRLVDSLLPDAPVARATLDWPALLATQVELYRCTHPDRTITVSTDPDVDGVVADPDLANGVIGNLLSNAVKYSPAGTPIAVVAVRTRDQVVTTVSDRGPGIAVDDRERIFDRGARFPNARRAPRGAGLGLFLARRSLLHMGGSISCEAAPMGGATFRISLPAAVDAPTELAG